MVKRSIIVLVGLISLTAPGAVKASLVLGYQFNGNGNWSLDGVGGNSTPVGTLNAVVPVGSTIEKAFLYSSTYGSAAISSINFDGTLYNAGSFTALGLTSGSGLQAFRADVTSQVASKIAGGSASPFSFSIQSENPNASIDGEMLAVIYSNPLESVRTIALFDGFSAPAGDTFGITFASPLPDVTAPGFESLLSLGIGYGYQGSDQYSTVSVNGRLLTSSAGGQDDGAPDNGGLITVGGLGDSPLNPVDPSAGPANNTRTDDELYNLAFGNGVNANPFLPTGSTLLSVNTRNPSNDDNIFFAGLNVTAAGNASVDPVPEPTTALFGMALCASWSFARVRRRSL